MKLYKFHKEQQSMLYYLRPVSNGQFSSNGILSKVKTIPIGTIVVIIPGTQNEHHNNIHSGIIMEWGVHDEHIIHKGATIFVDTDFAEEHNIELAEESKTN